VLTPKQRILRARLAAFASHANHDGKDRTEAARAAFAGTFEAQVRAKHPDLADAEIERRVAIARRLHFARLAYKSAVARSKSGRPK
jgi:hypothetical protein